MPSSPFLKLGTQSLTIRPEKVEVKKIYGQCKGCIKSSRKWKNVISGTHHTHDLKQRKQSKIQTPKVIRGRVSICI